MKKKTNRLLLLLIMSIVVMQGIGFYIKYNNLLENSKINSSNPSMLYACLEIQNLFENGWKLEPESVEASAADKNKAGGESGNMGTNSEVNITQQNTDQESSVEPQSVTVSGNTLALDGSEKSFTQVDESYFDDALFIGDSRMVGLEEYSGFENATFYADIGLTLYDLFDKEFIVLDGSDKKINLEEALSKSQFKKIYLMVGINEIGGDNEEYLALYKEMVEKIEEMEPNAIIFVQGIMYVTIERSETDKRINSPAIKERNEYIKTLADSKRVFYIDVNEVMADDTGNLNKEYSFDDAHLKAAYYTIWDDFLMAHGIA